MPPQCVTPPPLPCRQSPASVLPRLVASLGWTDASRRPPYTYEELAALAICSSPDRRLTAALAAQFVRQVYPFYSQHEDRLQVGVASAGSTGIGTGKTQGQKSDTFRHFLKFGAKKCANSIKHRLVLHYVFFYFQKKNMFMYTLENLVMLLLLTFGLQTKIVKSLC